MPITRHPKNGNPPPLLLLTGREPELEEDPRLAYCRELSNIESSPPRQLPEAKELFALFRILVASLDVIPIFLDSTPVSLSAGLTTIANPVPSELDSL